MDYYSEDDYEDSEEELDEMTETAVTTDGIEIKINHHALDTIASAAAHRICSTLENTVKEMVKERLAEVLDNAWEASVQAMAQQAIDNYLQTPRAKTNEWGESISGKMTTLSAMIPKTVEGWLTAKVDAKGQPTDYHRDQSMTRMQWMLQTLVVDQLSAETKKAASDVTEKARKLVSQHVGRFISEQMVPAISLDRPS